jgi:hypothetical protein
MGWFRIQREKTSARGLLERQDGRRILQILGDIVVADRNHFLKQERRKT